MTQKKKAASKKRAARRRSVAMPTKPDQPLAVRHQAVAKRLADKKPSLPRAR